MLEIEDLIRWEDGQKKIWFLHKSIKSNGRKEN